MKLLSFQVSKFRNIVDSGIVDVDPLVTCMVGKNEAGKSALLEALYLFNPAYDEQFRVDDQYPRWLVVQDRRSGDLNEHTPISITFSIDAGDQAVISSALGDNVLLGENITVSRKYNGERVWGIELDEQAVLRYLSKNVPESIQSLFSNSSSIEDIREILQETEADLDDGPSSDDLSTAKTVLQECGLDESDTLERIIDLLEHRLPQFFHFTKYCTLPGRIDFHELANNTEEGLAQNGLQTARALLKLAGTDIEQLGNEDYELRKGELEAVQIDLTNQVFEYWKQNPDLEVLIDVDKETVAMGNNTTAVTRFLDIRLRDRRTGYSNNFSQRSSGFQWFFSFLAAFSEFEGQKSPVVLLDEPALTLHGRAQADFLRFINERLAPSAPVIYTTHSPFMVEAQHLERVRIVEDKGPPVGSVASADVLSADPDSLFPLQAALGYDIAQNLFVGQHNLVVEGTSDYIYLTIMSRIVANGGHLGLDERWRILPAGGATNIPTFVSLIGPHLDVTVLADSDTKGMQRVTNMVERNLLIPNRLILASVAKESDHADIEDLFSEGDYLKLYNKTYGTGIRVSDLPAGNRTVKRIEAYRQESFDHGEVAETLLRYHHEISFTGISLDQFAKLIAAINETIES